MNLRCRCGDDCVKPAEKVLKNINRFYTPCQSCRDVKLNKFAPLRSQVNLEDIDADFGSCKCGKRHLDAVMAHVLKIMIETGLKTPEATLRDACVPLVTPGYPTRSVPYLPENSMVALADRMDKNCAKRIVEDVPEIKGVLNGNMRKTVGILDSNSDSHVYKLLAGCDMRCDVVQTPYGAICIYKHQGEIHIEFPKPVSPKVTALKRVLDEYNSPRVLDCTCGPGTLGITCLKAGAESVVFNDLWYPAARTATLNLEVNGFPVKIPKNLKELEGTSWSSPETPVALGDNFEVYSADLRELKSILDEQFDICIIDAFPGVETADLEDAVRDMCSDIVVI